VEGDHEPDALEERLATWEAVESQRWLQYLDADSEEKSDIRAAWLADRSDERLARREAAENSLWLSALSGESTAVSEVQAGDVGGGFWLANGESTDPLDSPTSSPE